MWKEFPFSEDETILSGVKRMRLYADEDIEEAIVDYIRDQGVNITSARELGHRGKPDAFHAALALKEKRFLLTKNAKDFLSDRKLPFHRIHGIIAIEGNMGDMRTYARVLHEVLGLIPYGAVYEKMKIHVSSNEALFRFIDWKGQMKRMRIEGDKLYEWVDEKENNDEPC